MSNNKNLKKPPPAAPAAAKAAEDNDDDDTNNIIDAIKDPEQLAQVTDVLQEHIIDAEYKIWKKNTPFLYDFVVTHPLEWPSLTCEWLPTPARKLPNLNDALEHQLMLGTHTSNDEQNYLMLATAVLPTENARIPPPNAHPRYDADKKEMGGHHGAHSSVGQISIKMKIRHQGEVHRARAMPQNHFCVASRGPAPEIYLWDVSKHPSVPSKSDPPFCPQAVCVGHAQEGYGVVWSPHTAGQLCTGAGDAVVCLWDTAHVLLDNKAAAAAAPAAAATTSSSHGTQIKPTAKLTTGHTAGVEDVDWHAKDAHMVGSVGDDKRLCLWDTRNVKNPLHHIDDAHTADINCIAFNPVNEYIVATAGTDRDIGIWDLRNLTARIHTLTAHVDEIYQLTWAPHNESVLASCAADRRVAIWDLAQIGAEQDPEDADDGPPELLFLHGGHTAKVSDVTWSPNMPWTVASVSEDNVLQIWNMAEEIYTFDEREDPGPESEDVLGEDELED